ncbi:hypothetical protein PALB_25340 [Pseudoalteromonas luteoviolacea B = ATCC 29581]|nr:hypothetical protein PALB_25340 [Pseudoalteromonas luteoviolacea B = ATCC 29581]
MRHPQRASFTDVFTVLLILLRGKPLSAINGLPKRLYMLAEFTLLQVDSV